MATTFHFRAVAPDGKVRTGILHGDTEKVVAQELRKQGLTPVYVGAQEKRSIDLKLPVFLNRGRRRDVLFFTQELSTLLNAGVPLDRALSITSELTERVQFRVVVGDIIRVLKGGKSLADSLATRPDYFSDLFVNMVRAGEASGSLAAVFDRLAEFERTRDDLRNYIISSMVYPCLLALVGAGSIAFLLTFVVPRFASVFQESHMKMPLPTMLMLESSKMLQRYGWMALIALSCSRRRCAGCDSYRWGPSLVARIPAQDSGTRGRAPKGRGGEVCQSDEHACSEQRASGPVTGHCRRHSRTTSESPAHWESSPQASAEAKDWPHRFAEQENFRRSPRTCSASVKRPDGWTRCSPEWPTSTKLTPAPRSGASRPCSNRS